MNETILQFGAGRFLRGFMDRFIQHANDTGQNLGNVVIVQSTPGQRAALLNDQSGEYPIVVRGYEAGNVIDREEKVNCISRALIATEEWGKVLECASSPHLRYLISNATEASYVLEDNERAPGKEGAPTTLAAKVAELLWTRFQAGGDPLVYFPCELIQENASKLRELVLTQAQRWNLSDDFQRWMTEECLWVHNLVDCIVSNLPNDDPRLQANPLALQIEPYALLAINKADLRASTFIDHPAIRYVDELAPFYLRKVRILNGLHTTMVGKYYGTEFQTVQDIMKDREAERWVRDVVFEEIVPTLVGTVEGVAEFAFETLDRFRNPFLAHLLSDISLHHSHKVEVRLQPTHDEYQRLYGHPPRRLAEAMQREIPKK